jgi:hypothetical protein
MRTILNNYSGDPRRVDMCGLLVKGSISLQTFSCVPRYSVCALVHGCRLTPRFWIHVICITFTLLYTTNILPFSFEVQGHAYLHRVNQIRLVLETQYELYLLCCSIESIHQRTQYV